MSSVSLPPPSGSAKLYATAKREWVIAPRAKPGRKPKQIPQDEAEYVQDDASEKGKKTQNRAAQRAFRERRQSQLSELQVRLQQYEQGEVERNVALQQLGKRLKEENEQLKQDNLKLTTENERLKARIATLEAAHAAAAWPSTSGAHNISSRKTAKRDRSEHSPPLRRRLKRLKTTESPVLHPSSTDTPSISSCASTNIIMSPMISALEDDDMMAIDTCNTTNLDGNIQEEDPDFTSCGMCTSSVDCICRQLGIDNRAPITIADEPSGSLSLLDNLPPYQPPVPLRHRRKSDPISSRPLPTNTRSSSQATSLGCSGDPSNCSACAGNAFGRAFCSALGNSVCTGTSCSKCHSKSSSPPPEQDRSSVVPLPRSINPSLTQCCGNPGQCRGSACSTINSVTARLEGRPTDVPGPSNLKSEDAEDDDIPMEEDNNVPCDVVWKTLEAHPNAHLANPDFGPSHLANLNLLAEVVARRSRCTLAPGEPTPEPEDFPMRARPVQTEETNSSSSDIHQARSNETAAPRVQIGYDEEETLSVDMDRVMVPRDVLQRHQRVTRVPTQAMRDAIALLDRQFGCS